MQIEYCAIFLQNRCWTYRASKKWDLMGARAISELELGWAHGVPVVQLLVPGISLAIP